MQKVTTPKCCLFAVVGTHAWLLFCKFFKKKCFRGHESFLWGHCYPCFGLLVMSPVGSLIRTLQRHICYTFPEIYLWCDTCQPLDGQHGCQADLFHIPVKALVGLKLETSHSMSEHSTDWAMPAQQDPHLNVLGVKMSPYLNLGYLQWWGLTPECFKCKMVTTAKCWSFEVVRTYTWML